MFSSCYLQTNTCRFLQRRFSFLLSLSPELIGIERILASISSCAAGAWSVNPQVATVKYYIIRFRVCQPLFSNSTPFPHPFSLSLPFIFPLSFTFPYAFSTMATIQIHTALTSVHRPVPWGLPFLCPLPL